MHFVTWFTSVVIFIADFESLCKSYDKAKKVVSREGMPRFYLRCLVEMMYFVNEVSSFIMVFLPSPDLPEYAIYCLHNIKTELIFMS